MCRRFVSPSQQDVERVWDVRGTEDLFSTRYNISPTMQVAIVYVDRRGGERKLGLARWGLVPFWAKGTRPPSHAFNARLDQAADKPLWRQPFRTSRCLIPATGWYEWTECDRVDQRTGELRRYKQPYFMHLPDRRPIGLAGLMAWMKPESGSASIGSCAMVTTNAAGAARDVHERMPVPLAESAHAAWLDPMLVDPDAVTALLAKHAMPASIVLHPVSVRVNGSRIDDASLIDKVELA